MDETHAGIEEPPSEPDRKRSRRLPLGALTLLVIVVVGIGVLIFGDDASDPSVSVPDLEGALGLPTQNGEAAPDFSIDLLDGTSFRLTDHLRDDGRPVILNLWASWCGPCRAEMPAFDAASKIHTEVLFLGVAVQDDPAAAADFAEEIGVSYPLAIDDADRVGRRYPSPGLPATYFISAEGTIVRTVFGQLDEDQLAELISGLFSV
jgi:thiol-disulfide isomerase/thioredoxin